MSASDDLIRKLQSYLLAAEEQSRLRSARVDRLERRVGALEAGAVAEQIRKERASSPVWLSASRGPVRMSDMADEHLKNAIAKMERHLAAGAAIDHGALANLREEQARRTMPLQRLRDARIALGPPSDWGQGFVRDLILAVDALLEER